MHYLICYDIANDRRRRRVVRVLEGYGYRLHESAFIARLKPSQKRKMHMALAVLLNEKADLLIIYPVCDRDMPDAQHLGHQQAPSLPFAISV